VAVEGELDDATSARLRRQLGVFMQEGCRRLVVDLRHTSVIAAPGVRVLIDAMRAIEDVGGSLVVLAPQPEVYELGRVRRLGELLAAMDDVVDEADAIHRLDRLLS
jgi:anti-anti-sigma factor